MIDAQHHAQEPARPGRPRSERARLAILHAVDDLLVEVGYAAMTMKGIAERAGVGRQTVYRWWSHKAEILFEACVQDAQLALAVSAHADPLEEITAYLDALHQFLAHTPAGAAYRALLGEAQHDPTVAQLLASQEVLLDSARVVVARVLQVDATSATTDLHAALLIGPLFFRVLAGHSTAQIDTRMLAAMFLRAVAAPASH